MMASVTLRINKFCESELTVDGVVGSGCTDVSRAVRDVLKLETGVNCDEAFKPEYYEDPPEELVFEEV